MNNHFELALTIKLTTLFHLLITDLSKNMDKSADQKKVLTYPN